MTTYTTLYTNNASTTLAAGITSASPSLQVTAGAGSLFPVLPAGFMFHVTLIKPGNPNIYEIVGVTGRSGDNFTGLLRNLEGDTPALSWNAGDIVALLPTAGDLNSFIKPVTLQAQKTNWALDIGAANAYVVHLVPALNASTIGMPIRWFAAHTNTGASTFNDGIIQAPLVAADGQPLQALDIIGGSYYECTWNGAVFILYNVRDLGFGQLRGVIGAPQVPLGVVLQWEASLAIAFTQMLGQLQSGQIASSITLPGSPVTTTQAVNDHSTKIATTAYANPGTNRAVPGHFWLPGGHIVNYGTANPNGGSATVTLDQGYTSASSWVVVTVDISSGATQSWIDPAGKTAGQFVMHNTGGSSFYIAVGF